MTILVECHSPQNRHRWVLRPGESARIGKSNWVEFSIPEDESLLDEHFSVIYRFPLLIESLTQEPIEVGGVIAREHHPLQDSEFRVGNSAFRWSTHALEQTDPISLQLSQGNAATESSWQDACDAIEVSELSIEGLACVRSQSDPAEAIKALMGHGRHEDSVRLIVGLLSTEGSIALSVDTLSLAEIPIDSQSREQIRDWCAKPSDNLRQQIQDRIADRCKTDPWTWCMTAIGWTNGCIASSDEVRIPISRKQIISCLIASLQLAFAMAPEKRIRESCVQLGLERLPAHGPLASERVGSP